MNYSSDEAILNRTRAVERKQMEGNVEAVSMLMRQQDRPQQVMGSLSRFVIAHGTFVPSVQPIFHWRLPWTSRLLLSAPQDSF